MKTRKLLSILLALALLASLLPAAALAEDAEEPTPVSSWDELRAALAAGGDYRLTESVYYVSEDATASLTVPAGKTATLDLNGQAIRADGAEVGVTVRGDLTLTDSGSGGVLTGAKTQGVRVEGGSFAMAGGAITGNGAGIWVRSGSAALSGGAISENTTDGYGEEDTDGLGLYLDKGTTAVISGTAKITDNEYEAVWVQENAELTMSGGVLSGDGWASAVALEPHASFTMTGGEIWGGLTGVHIEGADFTMDKGEDGSFGTIHGGDSGVCLTGDSKDGPSIFTMNAGAIIGSGYGFGVYLYFNEDSRFKFTGGEISGYPIGIQIQDGKTVMDGPDARVTDSAIGVHVIGEDAAFAMTDGLITDNDTGVEVDDEAFFDLSGGAVSDNGVGVSVPDEGVFYAYGGEICNNSETGVKVWGGRAGFYIFEDLDDETWVSGSPVGITLHEGWVELHQGDIFENEIGISVTEDSDGDGQILVRGEDEDEPTGGNLIITDDVFVDGNEVAGVYITCGDVTMDGGDVYGNGSGVWVTGGSFAMSGGWIDENDTGIRIDGGEVSLSGGFVGEVPMSVAEDIYPYDGNDVGVSVRGGSLTLSGAPSFGNDTVDIFLAEGQTVAIGDTLSTKNITVAVADAVGSGGRAVSSGLDSRGGLETFASAMEGTHIALAGGEATLVPGGVSLSIMKEDWMPPDATFHLNKGESVVLIATLSGLAEDGSDLVTCLYGHDLHVEVTGEHIRRGEWRFTVKAIEAGALCEIRFIADGGQTKSYHLYTDPNVPEPAYYPDIPVDSGSSGKSTPAADDAKKDPAACDGGDGCPLAAFRDLDPGAWYHDGVHFVLSEGWMQGLGDGRFAPEGTTTRAMAAVLLWNMAGRPTVNYILPFADVAQGAWYAEAVRWAAAEKIAEGWTDESGTLVFGPEKEITREQFAAMLYRYAQRQGKGFKGLWSFLLDFPDASDVSPWAVEAVSWMVMNGVVNGMDGRLNPKGSSTRAQTAAMVSRFAALSAE